MLFRLGLTLLLVATTSLAQWVRQKVDTTASLRGLAVVNKKIIWASGTSGTVIRTVDGGKTWNIITVPGAEKLDFRDIEAFDANNAYILSIGNGDLSRIYETADGGTKWKLLYKNTDEKAFFDAMSCGITSCYVLGDPVNGKFTLGIVSGDAGRFTFLGSAPPAIDGEAAFAASGTCLIVWDNMIWFVSGGTAAHVFRSFDSGRTWAMANTPLAHGAAGAGAFSIAMFDEHVGIIVGGDYQKPDETRDTLAFTDDGGRTWRIHSGLTGYRSGVTYVNRKMIIAVGTNGSDVSRNGGKTWSVLGSENLNAVQSTGPRATWAVGPKGMVVKLKP